jgi:hypothetical protein
VWLHTGSHLWHLVALETLWWCIVIHLIAVIYNRTKLRQLLSQNLNTNSWKWEQMGQRRCVCMYTCFHTTALRSHMYNKCTLLPVAFN